MQYEIVPARIEYVSDIAKLSSELGYPASEEDTQKWLALMLASDSHAVFAVVSQESVCGWVAVEKRLFLESGIKAEITGLVVGAAYRRNGIAGRLVSAAEGWARQQGLDRIVVRSNAQRVESHIFYPAFNYERTKTSHVYSKKLI